VTGQDLNLCSMLLNSDSCLQGKSFKIGLQSPKRVMRLRTTFSARRNVEN